MPTLTQPRIVADTRIYETDLASIASRAAVELDNLLLRRTTTLDAVKLLASKIEEYFQVQDDGGEAIPKRPTKAMIVHRAISNSPLATPEMNTLPIFSTETLKIVRQLAEIEDDYENKDIGAYRDFCIEVAHEATPRSSFGSRNPHPFRR